MRARHQVGRLVEEREGLFAADFGGDPVDAEDDLSQRPVVMGPGLDDGETADQVSLAGSNQLEDRRGPIDDHRNLLSDPGDEFSRIHRLRDHPESMRPFGPIVGRPRDGKITLWSSLGGRDPSVVHVEVDEGIRPPCLAADFDSPADGGPVGRLEDRGPARVEAGIP